MILLDIIHLNLTVDRTMVRCIARKVESSSIPDASIEGVTPEEMIQSREICHPQLLMTMGEINIKHIPGLSKAKLLHKIMHSPGVAGISDKVSIDVPCPE